MSIFLKIFLTTSIAIISFISLFNNYIIKIQKNELEKRLNNKIMYQKKINEGTISKLLFDLNKTVITNNLNSLYEDQEIVKIELIDYSRIINITLDDKFLGKKELIKTSIKLKNNSSPIGELNIIYTKDTIDEYINEYIAYILKLSIAVTLIFLLIIFYFLRKFTKSITKLTLASKEITSGNLTNNIDIKSNDEIGTLAKEFENMRVTLKNRIHDINDQLKYQKVLLESINIPIFIQSDNNKFIDCNQAFYDFFNTNREKVINKNIENILDDSFLSTAQSNFKNRIFKILDYKGKVKSLIMSKNVYVNRKDNEKIFINSLFDITEINKAKEKIERFNDELKMKVAQRTEELEDANYELEQMLVNLKNTQDKLIESEKMSSLGLLVSGVAHEINTPVGISLTAVTHFMENLKKIEKDFNEENITEDDFKNFLHDSNEISNLINNNLIRTANLVKSFKNIAVDQTTEEARTINLKNYIQEVLFSMSNITKNRNIDINIMCDDNLSIHTYPGALSQIITNLVINSLNHGFEKDILSGEIKIDIKKEKNLLKIIYKDNGKGIKKENLSKIFEPFYTTNRQNGGTGLGLNITYNLVTSILKGHISCESIENEETKFIITFNEEER